MTRTTVGAQMKCQEEELRRLIIILVPDTWLYAPATWLSATAGGNGIATKHGYGGKDADGRVG
jgi:hypothetical protein